MRSGGVHGKVYRIPSPPGYQAQRGRGLSVFPSPVMKGDVQYSNSGVPSKLFDLISFLLQELDDPFFSYQMPCSDNDKIGSICF